MVFLGAVMFLSTATTVQAARVTSLSPQGEVAQVRQVAIKFDEAMVPTGDPAAPAPATVQCTGDAGSAPGAGQGRWIDGATWAWDFTNDLPPGVRCTVGLRAGLKAVSGHAYSGPASYRFNTGGPFVADIRPDGGIVEEDQAFILRLTGAATPESVRSHVWCEASGIGERIPVRPVSAADRALLLKQLHLQKHADRTLIVACQQRLPSGAEMQLVWGKGVATPSGIANQVEKRFTYRVREPFSATFSCERENADAPCTPLRPLRVDFNSPVPRALAEKIRLVPLGANGAKGSEHTPTFDADDHASTVESVVFNPPLPENTPLEITLPAGLVDASGRALANVDLFPLKTRTGALPPLAKFSASPFGIIERFAEPDSPPLLPVTLRKVEAALDVRTLASGAAPKSVPPAPTAPAGQVSQVRLDNDADIIRWFGQVRRFDETTMTRTELAKWLPPATATQALAHAVALPRQGNETLRYDTRSISLLAGLPGVSKLDLPKPADAHGPRPFEVVGIPLPKPGFYVLEIASPSLGGALLGKTTPMYVRTTALVTNLGVHFKYSRENGLVWVTSLDKGTPVAGARVRVSDCDGQPMADGVTDAQGLARIDKPLPRPGYCEKTGMSGYFVSARVDDPRPAANGGGPDMAFVFSDWDRGIESWRFNVPTDSSSQPTVRAHTVFDRVLFRVGETVSMKHFIRVETAHGFALPKKLPTRVTIRHEGSGQTYHLPLTWRDGRLADSTFKIPPGAKLGVYDVNLDSGTGDDNDDDGDNSYPSGTFRVEAFRLPVMQGRIAVRDENRTPLVATTQAPLDVQINYVAGGGAANLPVRVSAVMRPTQPSFDGYDDFSFAPYRPPTDNVTAGDDESGGDDSEASGADSQKLVADKQPVTLDRNGAGALTLKNLPAVDQPNTLVLEASFADPNGEIQTLHNTTTVWPAAVVTGIQTGSWVSVGRKVPVKAIALDLHGKPLSGVPMEIDAIVRNTTTSRKRLVGGFYSYDSHTEIKNLGKVCSGNSDAHGLLLCDAQLKVSGNVELVAVAKDHQGHTSRATTSVWVTPDAELWFGADNTDRMDVLPEKKAYQPGDTARFQVRMPFRSATALVAVEREGIIETHLVELSGSDPTVNLKIKPEWGPNVYVSVLAVRGRIHEVPWYSFFTWGWRQPLDWFRAFWYEGREYKAPTGLVDLSKPAFRYGLAEIRVGTAAHRLGVTVKPDAATYRVRGTAHVAIRVTMPDGKPAPAGTEVAVAAVDEALLELAPNTSWDLFDAMLQRRSYGVETSTAQMQIVGRRHYGRKAVPSGGGGGKSPTRELFDSLLLWRPRVVLDARGEATVDVPLNDSLSSFRIVAITDVVTDPARDGGLFGTGQATIRTTQDLQLISGLPPLVRGGDAYRAQFTLRNTTTRAMDVDVTARGTALTLPSQHVTIPAGQASVVTWDVTAPTALADAATQRLDWEVSALARGGADAPRDAIKVSQQVVPAVPVTVQQATLAQVDGSLSLPMAPPTGAQRDSRGALRGGVSVSLRARLADGLPGVRRWFERYPYGCLEQLTSKAIGLHDAAKWRQVTGQLPAYLDADGLASYFPASDDMQPMGSDTLSAYLLDVTDVASRIDNTFALPADARERMLAGLTAFVEGRVQRRFWAPLNDLDLRKLAAIEALSRYGKASPRMLDSITLTPRQWPTSALLDWMAILQRMPDVPQRAERLAQASQILRSRLTYQGTRLVFSTEQQDNLWWLMVNNDVNAARTILTLLDAPDAEQAAWHDELPRLATGLLALQQRGAWSTTTANLWGTLALERFSTVFEKQPVTGRTTVQWQGEAAGTGNAAAIDWRQAGGQHSVMMPWPSASAAGQGSPATLQLSHAGSGRPWATIESLAAVARTAPFSAGYHITRTVTKVDAGQAASASGAANSTTAFTRGDVLRVRLDIDAQADMTWVVVDDPIPAGATILGSGLGRDSSIATQGEKNEGEWPAFVERGFGSYRAYYDMMPKGHHRVEYTVRLNNVGTFAMPATRVEALYAPEAFGELPNAPVNVAPAAQ